MPASVVLASVQRHDLVSTFSATGGIDAPLDVKISPKVTGRIEFLQVHEGDRVKKGQVIVRLDKSQVEADVQQAQANLAEAQYRLAQAKLTQQPTNVSVTTQIRQQQAGLNSAHADFDQVQSKYEAQLAVAEAAVTDAQGRIDNADGGVGGAKAAIHSAQASLDDAATRMNRILNLSGVGHLRCA